MMVQPNGIKMGTQIVLVDQGVVLFEDTNLAK